MIATRAATPLLRTGTATLVLKVTPLVALVNSPHPTLVLISGTLAMVVLSSPSRLRAPWPWLAAGVAGLAWDAVNWHGLDDHIFVMHYWLLAVGLACLAADTALALERSARALIGLTFAFAVVAKVAWGEVVNGRFYRAMLLLDERTSWLAHAAGIADPAGNHALVQTVHSVGTVTLDGGSRSTLVALTLVVGTFALEGFLAVAYLAPLRGRAARLRIPGLVAFCVATYSIIPVAGFGSLLLLMAASERRLSSRARVLLVLSPLALLAWAEVWEHLH